MLSFHVISRISLTLKVSPHMQQGLGHDTNITLSRAGDKNKELSASSPLPLLVALNAFISCGSLQISDSEWFITYDFPGLATNRTTKGLEDDFQTEN